MKRRYNRSDIVAEINITPFTDVILVLLIVVLIAAPLISQNSFDIKLPKSSQKSDSNASQQVYVTISAEGIIYLDSKLLTSKELKARLTAIQDKNSDVSVVVAADEGCRFQDVVKVLDIIKESEIKNIRIATQEK
jgi:biopolymer transport protein ExbD